MEIFPGERNFVGKFYDFIFYTCELNRKDFQLNIIQYFQINPNPGEGAIFLNKP